MNAGRIIKNNVKEMNGMKKNMVLILFSIVFLASCGSVGTQVKPEKKSYLTVETGIPDQGMARSELNKEASQVLNKTNLNKPVTFEYKKFSGNDVILFKSLGNVQANPVRLEGIEGGYKGVYEISHSDMALAKLKGMHVERVSARAISISDAINNGVKMLLQQKIKNSQTVNLTGKLNIVNVFEVTYSAKDVMVDFLVAYNYQDKGVITNKDKADFYAEIGMNEYYRNHRVKAYSMAQQGIDMDKECARCYYLKGLLNLKDKSYQQAVFNLEQAVKYNGDQLYYCQRLQNAYSTLYGLVKEDTPAGKKYKKELQSKAFALDAYIGRHFNPDGSVYLKKKPPISEEKLKVTLPETKEITLKNGLHIIEIPKKALPIFQLTLSFRFGSVHSDAGKRGMVDAMIQLLTEGVEGMNSAQIAEYIDQHGLAMSGVTLDDYSYVQCSTLTENAPHCIELMATLVEKANFPKKEYDKHMKKAVEYYHANTANAGYLANKLLYRLVFGKHNYGYRDVTLKTLSQIKREDILRFYKDYMHPENAQMMLAGQYDASTLALVKEKFASWTSGKKLEASKEDRIKKLKDKRSYIYVIDRPASKQVVIKYGQPALPFSNQNFLPFYMANKIFGATSSSRLFLKLREEQSLTYGAYSSLGARLESGIFLADLSVRPDVVGKAVSSLLHELKTLKAKGITETELKDKKGLEYGQYAMQLKGFGYVSMLMRSMYLGVEKDFYKDYSAKIAALTTASVNQAIQEILMPENGVIVVVGDSKSFVKQLQPLGHVILLDENLKPVKK